VDSGSSSFSFLALAGQRVREVDERQDPACPAEADGRCAVRGRMSVPTPARHRRRPLLHFPAHP
jgi:hypothetical protein